MIILLYQGVGEIRDRKDGNVNSIAVSMELQSKLRTWHSGQPLVGEVVPIILGRELPSQQCQFVVRRSSIKIDAIGYSFWGEMGYIYAQKVDGNPLDFQEWALSKIPLSGGVSAGVYSQDPPAFLYRDLSQWNCYSSLKADCPEYGQLAPVLDLSTTGLDFKVDIPKVYGKGAKLDLKVELQTQYSAA